MSMDLIISDTGQMMIASNRPFAGTVSSVDFDLHTHFLIVNYTDQKPQALPLPVQDRMISDILTAARLILAYFKDGFPVEGFDVPLVHIDV
jgi:hypothetical protein